MTTGKTIALTIWTFIGKVMSLLLNMLSIFVIAFPPRKNHLLISWLQSLSAMILEPKKRKSVTTFSFSSSTWHEVMGPHAIMLVFFLISFKPAFSISSFTLIKRFFSSSLLSALEWYHLNICFSWQSWFQLAIHPAWHFESCAMCIS